ncbi:uncharacterized protein VTP21DRAFT_5552 [Calcarisporiella thermophila]|uniref:uncharacterized protein n=1 Tax=Calcarisporiella thermophila TaxID=911321 RepID=UPI0037443500
MIPKRTDSGYSLERQRSSHDLASLYSTDTNRSNGYGGYPLEPLQQNNDYVEGFLDDFSECYMDDDADEFIDAELNHRKRESAAREIFQSERSYVAGLCKIRDIFLVPLTARTKTTHMGRAILMPEEVQAIFGNLEQIVELHEQMLKELSEREKIWGPTQLVGDIFIRYCSYFRLYAAYLKNFPVSISTLERLCKSNAAFKKLLNQCNLDMRLENMPLQSYLLLPVQRIPRYRLLLDALLRRTAVLHPDYRHLVRCVEQISIIADEVNDHIGEAENQRRIVEIQSAILNLPYPLVHPQRRLIKEGHVQRLNGSSNIEQRVLFLFNDRLVYGKVKERGIYSFKGMLDLINASVAEVDGQPCCFQILPGNGERSHLIRAGTPVEQAEWIQALESIIPLVKVERDDISLRSGSSSSTGKDSEKRGLAKAPSFAFVGVGVGAFPIG